MTLLQKSSRKTINILNQKLRKRKKMLTVINYSVCCNSKSGFICSIEENCLWMRVQNLSVTAQGDIISPFVTK